MPAPRLPASTAQPAHTSEESSRRVGLGALALLALALASASLLSLAARQQGWSSG